MGCLSTASATLLSGLTAEASDTRPKDQDQQDLALVSSPPPVTSDASEAQTRDENLLKELMELRTIRNREGRSFLV
ncbi:hypothetical protein WMY93_022662 [Mugilogobius chulae]|uniref:Uncharacterized protein n=1 Tax=Mugilogobius chulae TaxID=88201 RepID=A0AAW0NCG2_9GOBI